MRSSRLSSFCRRSPPLRSRASHRAPGATCGSFASCDSRASRGSSGCCGCPGLNRVEEKEKERNSAYFLKRNNTSEVCHLPSILCRRRCSRDIVFFVEGGCVSWKRWRIGPSASRGVSNASAINRFARCLSCLLVEVELLWYTMLYIM